MMKRGTRVTVDGKPGVIVGAYLKRHRLGWGPRHGTLFRRVRLDDGTLVYAREEKLEQVR